MPKYTLNGKTYNIPDSLTQKFESENPNATVAYNAGGKNYNIPVNKREKFLKSFPDAVSGEKVEGKTPQQKQSTPWWESDPAYQQDQQQLTKKVYNPAEDTMGAFVGAAIAEPPKQQPQQTTQKPAAKQQVSKPSTGPYKPTIQEQMAFGMNMGGVQNTIDNATKGIDTIESASKKASPFGGGAGLGNNSNLRKGQKTFDAEKGAFVDTYLTSDGREFRDAQQANDVQAELDNNADEVRYRNAMKSLGMGDMSAEKDKPIEQRLKEAYAERMELQRQMSEIAKRETESRKGPRFPSMVGGFSDTYTMSDESRNLSSALRLLERRITALEAERDDEGQSMFWRGTADTLKDPSAYSLGLTDLADTGVMSQLKAKLDAVNGDVSRLSDSEKSLVRNYMMNQEAQRLNENRGNMYGFGQMFGQSLPFMAEFYLTGGFMGLGSAGTRLGTKMGLKMAGSEIGKQMTKNLGGRILLKTGQSVLKGTGRVGGALAGGALQSNTIGAAKTYSDIANRNIGNLTINDNGNLDFKDSEGIAESFLKGQLTNAFENGSELLGPAFDFAPNYLARVIKNKVSSGAINKMLSNKVWRGTNKLLRKFGVQGLFGEGMEEEANNIGNVLIGESNWFKDPNDPNKPAFFDGEEQFKTWAGVALTGAILRGPAIAAGGYQKAQYYANKYNLNASDNQMRSVFGDYDRYQNIKAMLDGATNENMGSVLNGIMRGGQLSNQEKESVVMYAQDLVNLRGFNIGSVVAEAVGAQSQPRVASYQIKGDGKSFDELDENGNVIEHHEYETNEEMKAGLYEAQQKRFDNNLNSDIGVMKSRPADQYGALLREYCAEVGVDPADFEAMLSKPSMERSEAEQQLVAPFAQRLHDTVYDSSMLHEEQSKQDGEEIADANSIDLENGTGEEGSAIMSAWKGAEEARKRLFERNEDIAQEILSREQQGLSHQEIISSLDTFTEEERQIVIDYYNQKARYEGYVNRMNDKINEEAVNSRNRHTFKGTINGNADLSNVYTITDGENEYYLVSGNITTDPATGQITGSDSGLIIGMDLDGSFVQIGDTSGYSVMQPTMSLDQFEEAERIRLQEQITSVIDPTGAMDNSQQGNEEFQGMEQQVPTEGTNSSTQGNEPEPSPVVPTRPVNSPSPAGGAEQAPVTIESVTDKDNIKRYEKGIPVDDAITDIQNDGFDVNEVADASIAEAQQTIDKINGKQTKTRKDLMDKKNAQDVINYYNNVKARWAEMNAEAQPAESEENVNVEPEQPIIPEKPVSSQQNLTVEEQKQQRIVEAKAKYGELFDDDFTKANDVFELVSMWVGRKRNLAWDDVNGKRGLQKELGWTRKIGGDTKYIETLLAKNGEGMGVDEFVHMVWESPENDVNGEKRWDDTEIKNALLELLKSAQSKSDVVDYALNTRIANAEASLREQRQREAVETENQEEIESLTAEQIANMEANLPFHMPTDEDIPDSPIVKLEKAIEELRQQEGMPSIRLVNTDRMSDDEWYDIASAMYGGAFVSQEEIDFVRESVLREGLYIIEDSGAITVYSDSQTPEELKYKVEYIKEQNDGRSNEEETGGLEAQDLQRPQEGMPGVQSETTPAAEGATDSESQGGSESDPDGIASRITENGEPTEEPSDNGTVYKQEYLIDGKYPVTKVDEPNSKGDYTGSYYLYNGKRYGDFNEIVREIDSKEQPQTPSREDYLASHPLTEEQIMADTEASEDEKLNAIDFLNGEDSVISRFYYDQIYERAQKKADTIAKRKARFQGKEEKSSETNPMAAIEKAADEFRAEQERKSQDQKDIDDALKEFTDFLDNAKGSSVLDKFMRKGLEGNDKAQASLLDAFTLTNEAQRMFLKDLLRLASKVGYAYIKSGIHDAQAWVKKMDETIGRMLQEKLGWDTAITNEFVDEVWQQKYTVDGQRMRLSEHAERLKNTKPADQTVNVNKKENNEPENVVSSQQEKPAEELEGDSAEFAEREKKIESLRRWIKEQLEKVVFDGYYPIKMQDVKAFAKGYGLDDLRITDLQELVEAEIVNMAREIANAENVDARQKFDTIVKLYEKQPSLNARDNDRINKQQYSTPAPMAYLMGLFTGNGKKVESGLEPSAGNGMLTINLPKEKMHVNDIDEMRLSNLQKQGFGEVTSQDGLQPFGEKEYDVIVTNPPFGSVTPKVYDGLYEISALEHQMAINALESMKDDGRAAIIIGGNTEYNTNGTIKGKDRAFLNYLYAHYNVVDVINMDGKTLYSRQGTGFPVRMILINGRKEFNPKDFAPVQSKARAEQVKSYDELFKRVNDDILSDKNKPASVHDTESGEGRGVDDSRHGETSAQTGVRNVRNGGGGEQPSVLAPNGRGVQRVSGNAQSEGRGDTDREGSGLVDRPVSTLHTSRTEAPENRGSETSQTEPGGRGGQLASRGMDSERHTGESDGSVRVGQRGSGTTQSVQQPEQQRGLSTEKVPYKKQSSNPFTLDSLMPAEQADEVKKILEELGDVDQFLVDELGYANKEELHKALAAEQIDSVAMAIHQMNQGNAFIIGDQTGIGKGRQAAALIRYAVKKGGNPVFITVKKGLFSDMYRDLCDIGSPGLRPFIWCAKDKDKSQDITDADGNVVYKWSEKEQKRVADYILKNGKLPPEYDYIVTTYDSFKSGTLDYENGQKKARNFGKGKSAGSAAINGQQKRDALEVLARNSFVIMDESHNAGGDKSNISKFLQYITVLTKGTTFLSATFAKRPENMPIYALRTAISKAGVKVDELIQAVKKGGATFQEVMSKALTGAGQMIRRERNMEGVTIDWKGIEDEDVIQKQREQYDTIIGLFNDIIDFQRTYVDPIVNKMNDDAADEQGEIDHTPGTRDMGINNTPFASRTYNMVQQVLLSLKAEETGKRAVEYLKAGRKPVIAVANTNEGAADEAVGMSEEDLEMPDLSINLKKGLQGTLRITKKDAFGNEINETIPFDKLSEEGQKRYAEIMDAIENASSGLSLSPIDVIKNELKKAGYKVGELTGRKAEFVYNEDGTVKRVKRQDTDKKRTAADFNNGNIDALVINRSAGTGISLHASSKFKDQRQRIMIVAQAQGDVNDEVQMRGRIDRTGQVLRGMYEYVVSQIPSEQRLLMMLKAKLRSLDANTTSSQKSKFNEMQVQDIINKYGDDIVIQYLAENPEYAAKMVDPLDWGEGFEAQAPETLISSAKKKEGEGATASKILGRMALLKVKEQEKMLSEIGELYQAEIDRLNEMGENDLEITEMPLRAKTLKKDVWEEGVEPGGKNPFADNSYVEEVEMDVLRKPMKAEEVKKSQARLLGGKTWDEYKQDVLNKANDWADKKKEETTKTFTERAEKKATAEKEKYAKGAKKAQEKNGMTDAEIEKNAQFQYDTFYKQEMEKLQNALEAIDKQKEAFENALETFTTEGVYALPTDIYDLGQLTFEPSFGKVIDIKISDNFSTTASTISFATLDGRRKITIPVSGMVKQNNGEKRDIKPVIVQQTAQTRNGMFGSNVANTLKVLEQNVDNWDKLTSTATRKKGHIITGNLLKALTSLRSQNKGGKLISYTTDTGEIRQGILMSDNFDPGALTSKNPISSAKEDLHDWMKDRKIVSADKEVTIKNDGYRWYKLKVPKSKKKGEKYFNDKVLLSLVYGNQFEGSTQMSASFSEDNLDAVLKRLDELGVTVESSKEDDAKRMITTHDPMEAIEQAAESWRKSNGKTATNSKLQEIADMVNGLSSRSDLKGSAPTYSINSRQDLEAMKGKVSSRVYREIERLYADPDNGAAYIPRAGIVVVFGEHLEDAKEAEAAWWHEQTHSFWQKLPENERRKFGYACFDWLRKNRPDIFNHITKPGNYERYDWLNEACAFLIGNVAIESYGTEKFLYGNLVGNPEICNFANELRNHIKNGRQESTNAGNNQLRRLGEGEQTSATEVRGSSQQGQGRKNNVIRPEEESELPEDPIQAIEQSAKRWIKQRKEAAEESEALKEYSAKQIYNERLNRVETVFSEAYQDAMVSLKTAQNAIAGDKDIPDSQNAYMAENLMHGKNKNEMDLYNKLFRDPLIKTINKIMNLTGMNWGDVDRYVYTKSGLERNREFFVRDWLEAERNKPIRKYEDLNPDEQEIFDRKAATIETLFEDGDIETEEEKQKELGKALKEAHKEYVDEVERQYKRVKSERYMDLQIGNSLALGMDSFTFADYLSEIDKFIRDNIDSEYVASEHDYSGFRAMYGDEDGKYDEDVIIEELMDTEDQIEADNVDTLWEQIQNATRYGLERYREAGMRSDEQIDQIEQMFHWYVPMRGFKENMGEDMYQYFSQKGTAKSYIGGLLKHAKGRGSEAQYPISTIFAMTYKAISDCNQNLVNQKLYRLCQANPNDLVILSDSWAVLNETTGEWEEVAPDIPEDADEEDVRQITLAWEENMQQLASEGKAKKIKGRGHFDYKPMDKKKQSEHIIDVRINGQPKKMIVTSNPRMAQALNGQLRFERGKNVFSKWNAAIKNFMASVFTSYSPTFALRNMFRDWTHFRMMLGVREGRGYAKQASKYYRQSLFKMVGLFKKYRDGKLDESNEMERDFKDFMDNGGITGFVFMQKIDDIQKEMEDIYKKQKAGKPIRLNNKLWEKILGAIEALNEGIENNARFATYRTSRHYAGRTRSRSAYDAKEITVNFNRKGAGSKTAGFKSQSKAVEDAAKAFGITSQILGEGRIFFNATVQAIATTFKNFQNADGSLNKPYIAKWAAKYALPPFMFGLALPLINKALAAALDGGDGDDDPYANLPEWTRRKNLCFYIGNGNFITIPIGQELAAFLTLGDIFAGNTYAPDLKPINRSWDDEMLGVMNTFSPVDVDTKITKGGLMEDPVDETIGRTFSVLAPLVAVQQNLGWTGRPIYREDRFQNDQYTPEYQMVYSGTNPVLVNASKLLHELGGGDDVKRGKMEVNPAIVQYLWEQYSGGPGKFLSNTLIGSGKDLKDLITEGDAPEFNIRKIEGLKAFVQQGDDRTQYYRAQAKYRKYSEDAKKLHDAIKGYENGAAENPEYLLKLEEITKGEDFARYIILYGDEETEGAEKNINELNKAANKAEGKERKELRKIYNEQVKEVVDLLDNVPNTLKNNAK